MVRYRGLLAALSVVAGLARAAADAGMSWVETVSISEVHHFEPPRADEVEVDEPFRLRTSKSLVAIADGGVVVSSVPLEQSASPARREFVEQGATSLHWPRELSGRGGHLLAAIVNGLPARLISRKATSHLLGPAHVYEVDDGDFDASSSCGGLSTISSERVQGTITVLDGTSLIVAANLSDDESEENNRHFRDELEDGGISLITGHWLTTVHRTVTIEVSRNRCDVDQLREPCGVLH